MICQVLFFLLYITLSCGKEDVVGFITSRPAAEIIADPVMFFLVFVPASFDQLFVF